MILICYHASVDAQAAIDRAGELMPVQTATVLTVWDPFLAVVAHTGTRMEAWLDGIDPLAHGRARGARCPRPRRAGRRAGQGRQPEPQPRTRARGATIAETILSEAEDVGRR